MNPKNMIIINLKIIREHTKPEFLLFTERQKWPILANPPTHHFFNFNDELISKLMCH